MKYLDLDGLTHFWEIIKNKINTKVDASGGDTSNTTIKTMDSISTEFPVPVAGETMKTFTGKVKKFITDFNNFKSGIITVGKLVNNFQTASTGYALDARAGKTLNDAISQLNQDLQTKYLEITQAYFSKAITSRGYNYAYQNSAVRIVPIHCNFAPSSSGFTSNETILTLPTEYRPNNTIYFRGVINGDPAEFIIDTNGIVKQNKSTSSLTGTYALDLNFVK